MTLLKETNDLMRDLAENLLPNVNAPEKLQKAQENEKVVVKNLDALIKMILDQGAEEQQKKEEQQQQQQQQEQQQKEQKKQQNPQNSGKKQEQKQQQQGKPTKPGGNPKGKGGPEEGEFVGREANEWGLLPEREYSDTATVGTGIAPKGYEDLLERFRRTIAREGTRLPK